MLGNNNTLNVSWQCALFRVLFLKIHNKARLISGFVVFWLFSTFSILQIYATTYK